MRKTLFNANFYESRRLRHDALIEYMVRDTNSRALYTEYFSVARKIFSMCGCDMKWLHLECDDTTRRHRLEQRDMAPDEIEARMTFGDSLKAPGEAIVVDTSRVAAESLFGRVKQLLGRD